MRHSIKVSVKLFIPLWRERNRERGRERQRKKWDKADSVGNLLKGEHWGGVGAAQISSEDIKTKGMTGTSYQKTIKGVEGTVFYL